MSHLTPRLQECAELVADGYSNAEIAQEMGVELKSAWEYIHRLYQHYGIDGAYGQNRGRLVVAIQDDMALSKIMGEA